jgi:hypothetical protein
MHNERPPGHEPDDIVRHIGEVVSTMGGTLSVPGHEGLPHSDGAGFRDGQETNVEMSRLAAIIDDSADMNFDVWVRNLEGVAPSLGNVIRERAECAARQGRPLEVLQIGKGMPLAALSFHGDKINQAGDYLHAGPHGSHDPPKVRTTAIVGEDYVAQFLASGAAATLHERNAENYLTGLLSQVTSALTAYEPSVARQKSIVRAGYQAMEERGDIATIVQGNPTVALEDLLRGEGQYDIILADLSSVGDREACLRAIQACLTPGGRAMIPLEWWMPNPRGRGTVRSRLVSDMVPTENGDLPLGDYLAETDPESYQVLRFPGAHTLCVTGTGRYHVEAD